MLLRLLRAAYQRPLTALAVVLTIALAMGLLGVRLVGSGEDRLGLDPRLDEEAEIAPRTILNRGWFDRLPEKDRDRYELWVFFGGGIGVHEQGSRFEGRYEIVDFERQGQKLTITFLQSKETRTVPFSLARCDDKPPFSLCLSLENMPGGTKKLYGFAYDEELGRALPWARAKRAAARAQTAGR